jgi:hypothetical protein
MGLGMITGWTFFDGLAAGMNIAAVPATPGDILLALKDAAGFNVGL